MPPHDPLFKLELPETEPPSQGAVVPFPQSSPAPEVRDDSDTEMLERPAADRFRQMTERLADTWRTAWIGDGLLGMRPRPVADLARQFWFAPKPYIRDAWVLRVPYAIYGTPVIFLSAAAHLLLFIVSYPSVLAAAGLLVLFLSLFL